MAKPNELQQLFDRLAAEGYGPDLFRLQHRLRRLRAALRGRRPGRAGEGGAELEDAPAAELERLRRDVADSAAFAAWRREHLPRPEYPEELPVAQAREELAALIRDHQVVVIAGETGSGKTTQLPKICLGLGRGVRGMIGCTQPRRVAAVSVAERVAAELATDIGGAVGYQVRFEEKARRETFVRFMTDGILLSQTRGDPDLLEYDTLIIDEAHERSLNIDFLLGYLKRLLPRRPDLKVIISSATLEVERFSAFFGNAPVLQIPGRTYPVTLEYRPCADDEAELPVLVGHALEHLFREHGEGDALVFMSGEQEIRETIDHLERRGFPRTEILPLFSRLTPAEQRLVFHPGVLRRIVVTTNVAETSVTVPRVRYVVDAGLARIKRYHPRTQVESLQVEPVSQASANQRAGRCGRVGPGICARLYSEEDFASRPEYTDPEIKRSSLAGVILQMALLRLGKVEEFPFIEPPSPQLIKSGYEELEELGALDEERTLTRAGKRIAALSVEPRFGRMLLAAAERGTLEEALVIVSALSIQEPRLRPAERREAADLAHAKYRDKLSDFKSWLHLWREIARQKEKLGSNNRLHRWCKEHFLSYLRVREWQNIQNQLREELARTRFLRERGDDGGAAGTTSRPARPVRPAPAPAAKLGKGVDPADIELHKSLLCGLLSRCGKYHDDDKVYRGARETRFVPWPGSGLAGSAPRWIMAAEIVETSRSFARCCAVIEPAWVEEIAPHLLKYTYSDPNFDEREGCVRAQMSATLYGLPVVEKRRVHYGPVDPAKARAIFLLEGLVRRRLISNLPFYRENCRLIARLEDEQNKLRRQDLLADEEALFQFYDQRLPADLCTLKQLERFVESERRAGRKTLFMRPEDVSLQEAGGLSRELFPPVWSAGEMRLPLSYRFEPGHPEDGVSCAIPLGALPGIDPAPFEWLVPGLLGEKIAQLLRSMPRGLRKEFTPVPETVERCLQALGFPAVNPQDDFYARLAGCLNQLAPVKVQADDFRPAELPPFLKMHFRLIGADGRIHAQGRDLRELQAACRSEAREQFAQAPKSAYERAGLTRWDFELPERLPLPGGAVGFPGLIDRERSVELKVYETPEPARSVTRRGATRLGLLELEAQAKKIARSLPLHPHALLNYAALGGGDATLRAEILDAAALYVYDGAGLLPRRRDDFEKLLALWRTNLYEIALAAAQGASLALLKAAELHALLRADAGPAKAASLADIRLRLERLVFPGFVRAAGAGNAPHLPRYLEALRLRLHKLDNACARDVERMAKINPLWRQCEAGFAKAQKAGRANAALGRYRWLLEEYAVSLFAQETGAAVTVSSERLAEIWREVEAEFAS